MKTNKVHLVKMSVAGKIHSPLVRTAYRTGSDGVGRVLPGTGGITYNYAVGDPCMHLVGDHVEPGVSVRNESKEENNALMYLACVGNEATVLSGEAKGQKGYVTGMHGGIEHVLVCFEEEVLETLAVDDRIQIKAFGTGLKIEGFEDIHVMNLDPNLLEKIPLEIKEDHVEFPVVAIVPAYLMGSGVGSASGDSGDYDIMTGDKEALKECHLENLRFGDFVFLEDCDNTYGRQYLKGSGTVGIVVHSNCILSGHGPGVTTLLSSKKGTLRPRIEADANLKNYMKYQAESR